MNLSVPMSVYIALSAVMFLEYAVWGAWAPVLAARLLGPLKMSGKQTGWIYSTLPIACIVSPLVAGQVADKWVNTEWILAACHLVGAVLLLVALKHVNVTMVAFVSGAVRRDPCVGNAPTMPLTPTHDVA